MKTKCQKCITRSTMTDLLWTLEAGTTGANVHRYSNAKQMLIGALDFVRMGRGECQQCKGCLSRATALREGTNESVF